MAEKMIVKRMKATGQMIVMKLSFIAEEGEKVGGLFKPKEFTLSYLDEGIWHDIKFPNSAATDEWKEAWDIAKWKNSNPAFSRLV